VTHIETLQQIFGVSILATRRVSTPGIVDK